MTGRASIPGGALIAIFTVIAYALLAHAFSTLHRVGVVLLPLALAPLAIALALRFGKAALLAALAIAACVLMLPVPRELLQRNLAWIYFAQDSALNAALCYLFGHTLRRGRVPLCTRIALALQVEPSARLLRYTRFATAAWSCFFAAVLLVSTALFFGAARSTWSVFANLLYWPLLLAMFALEYGARLIALPRSERAGPVATIAAFRAFAPRRPAAPEIQP